MTASPIRVHGLSVSRRGRIVVDNLSGAFLPGTSTAIVGPNGAGKTSLMEALAGDATETQGTIERPSKHEVAYLPQSCRLENDFPVCVFDLVAMGLWHAIGTFAALHRRQAMRVSEAIAAVGLTGAERRLITELSAGQIRRALFARVVAQDASAILLDEPFSGLDAHTTEGLLGVLRQWRDEGRTVVTILHEIDLVRVHFDAALVLARRAIAWGPVSSALTASHLQESRRVSRSWDATHALAEDLA